MSKPLTVEERTEAGKAARELAPLASHGQWAPASDGRDPVAVLEGQATERVLSLVPIRYGRMSASAFAFYRGAAAIMAADLATQPHSGLRVQLCGDAHLSNFGGFASAERDLVFDINDFDETLPGPFEWDIKRLAASLDIAARSRGFNKAKRELVVRRSVLSYGDAMREFAGMDNLTIWYSRLDVSDVLGRWGDEMGKRVLKNLRRGIAKAEGKDRMKALAKLTEVVDGETRFRNEPPLLVPVEQVFDDDQRHVEELIAQALDRYTATLPSDRRHLLGRYRYAHLARKVVGVGSVGTRAWVALLLGRDQHDALFLQVKEAQRSVLEPYLGEPEQDNHGQRVVDGQRVMQAAGDIFLGWHRATSPDGGTRDFYVRQLWDWKASVDVEVMSADVLGVYGEICGWALARAHARSGDAIAIAAYLGKNRTFSEAIVQFAARYAKQNVKDHAALLTAIADGRVAAQSGL